MAIWRTSHKALKTIIALAVSIGFLTFPATAKQGLSITRGGWVNGNTAIMMSGSIEFGDAAVMRKAIREAHGAPIIAVLDSPGGNLAEALKIGRMLSEAGATTFVPSWGTCASACFYTFAGGKSRFVGEGARMGVHQFSYSDTLVEDANTTAMDAQNQTSEINLYLLSSGVSPLVGTLAGTVPPDEMLFFDYEDLKTLGIVTYYSKDGGKWASAIASDLPGGKPLTQFTKDPDTIDWCNVPVFSADGTFKKDPSACTN